MSEQNEKRRGRPSRTNDAPLFVSLRLPKSFVFKLKALAAWNHLELKDFFIQRIPELIESLIEAKKRDAVDWQSFWKQTSDKTSRADQGSDPIVSYNMQATLELKNSISDLPKTLSAENQDVSIASSALSLLNFLLFPSEIIHDANLIDMQIEPVVVSWCWKSEFPKGISTPAMKQFYVVLNKSADLAMKVHQIVYDSGLLEWRTQRMEFKGIRANVALVIYNTLKKSSNSLEQLEQQAEEMADKIMEAAVQFKEDRMTILTFAVEGNGFTTIHGLPRIK